MLRKSYFQSSENPLQSDRLPLIRTELEFPEAISLSTPGKCGEMFFMLLVASVVAFLLPLLRQTLYETHAWLAGMLALAAIGLNVPELVRCASSRHNLRGQLHWLMLTSIVALHLLLNIPLLLQSVMAAIVLGYFSFSFGEYWAFYCTASPLERSQAKQLRASYRAYLGVTALLPVIFVVVSTALGGVQWALLGLPTIALLAGADVLRATRDVKSLTPIFEAWKVWWHYSASNTKLPGMLQTPSGDSSDRTLLVGVTIFATAIPFLDPLASMIGELVLHFPANTEAMLQNEASQELAWHLGWEILDIACQVLAPLILVLLWPVVSSLAVIIDANRFRQPEVTHEHWQSLIRDIRKSSDPIERDSIYIGRNIYDGSPLLVPQRVFSEHAHFLGDSGSGKTSLGLAPLIEQLVAGPPCSIVVLDLKADSLELYATMQAALQEKERENGFKTPIKHFTNEPELTTFAFNPFDQAFLKDLDLYLKTDILCSALGLDYGNDYGAGYYSSANATVLHETMKRNPNIQSLREAADCVHYLMTHASRKELNPSTRDAGDHVHMVLKRLGSLSALNVTSKDGYPDDVVANAIDLSQLFLHPQMLYFHLPSTLAPHTAPEIGRLVISSLLVTAKRTERRHPVYLIIDEFQRMVAKNLEMILQLARSMGVSVILANQTMQDLKTPKSNLVPAIEGNCRFRQWFSVSLPEDRERIVKSSGQTVETFSNRSVSTRDDGTTSTTDSEQQVILPRLSENDILLASDHPTQSIVRISRGQGYAELGGLATIVQSNHHISLEEYERRKKCKWPTDMAGSFVPQAGIPQVDEPAKPQGPVMTTEIVGSQEPNASPLSARSKPGKRATTKKTT